MILITTTTRCSFWMLAAKPRRAEFGGSRLPVRGRGCAGWPRRGIFRVQGGFGEDGGPVGWPSRAEGILEQGARRHRGGGETDHVHRRAEQRDRNHRRKQRRVKVSVPTPRFGRGRAVCTDDPSKRHVCGQGDGSGGVSVAKMENWSRSQ